MNQQYLLIIIVIGLVFGLNEINSNELYIRKSRLKRSLQNLMLDNRGCDAIVASCGRNGQCCDEHDSCYKKYHCTSISWFYLWGNCHRCNLKVMACIALRNPGESSCCIERNCGVPW